MLNNFFKIIKNKIKQGDVNSPCLFLGSNLELTNSKVKESAYDLLKDFSIPRSYLYTLEDNGEKIKIKDIKEFVKLGNSKPGYPFQIFFIENFYRLTLTSANSLLKFFEEPGKHNIIFLTSVGENGILDTILSRVQIININSTNNVIKNNLDTSFYYDLINSYFDTSGEYNKNNEMFSYFFKNKLEKDDYINFLENLIYYFKNNIGKQSLIINPKFLIQLDDDINAIKQNNVNAKYIVDKWLLKI